MSRTKAAVVGIGLGVGGKIAFDAVKDGRLTISLPFLRRSSSSSAPLRAPHDAAAVRSRTTSFPLRTEF